MTGNQKTLWKPFAIWGELQLTLMVSMCQPCLHTAQTSSSECIFRLFHFKLSTTIQRIGTPKCTECRIPFPVWTLILWWRLQDSSREAWVFIHALTQGQSQNVNLFRFLTRTRTSETMMEHISEILRCPLLCPLQISQPLESTMHPGLTENLVLFFLPLNTKILGCSMLKSTLESMKYNSKKKWWVTSWTVWDIDSPLQMCVGLSIASFNSLLNWMCNPPFELSNTSSKVLRCSHYEKDDWFIESTQEQQTQITMETMGPHTYSHQELHVPLHVDSWWLCHSHHNEKVGAFQ